MPEEVRSLPPVGFAELLEIFKDGEPRTRSQLGELTGWARATVDSRVQTLVDAGILAASSVASTGGRPSSRFALHESARLVIAGDLGHTHGAVALTDLLGHVLAQRREPLDIEDGPEIVLRWMLRTAHSLLNELDRPGSDIAAIGIGVPSPVRFDSGRPFNPVGMTGWTNFDIPAFVRKEFDVPTLVDNDVNLMALGERAVAHPEATDMLFIKVATGIGAGIISGGTLQRGKRGIAGDIGHVPIARGRTACACGNTGCLGTLAALPAIADVMRSQGFALEHDTDVAVLVANGVVDAIQAVRQAGRDIGELLVTAVSLLNPELVVVGGPWGQSIEHLIAGIREVVYSRALPLVSEHLAIVSSRAGDSAAILGASRLAIDYALSPDNLQRAMSG